MTFGGRGATARAAAVHTPVAARPGDAGHRRGEHPRPLPGLAAWLDAHPGQLTLLGIGASGDGRLAATLLPRHDLGRVTASFLERDPVVAAAASQAFRVAGLTALGVVHADEARSESYAGRVPADLVLLGPAVIDGPAPRRRGLGEALPLLLADGGHVVWWSGRSPAPRAWARALTRAGLDDAAPGPDREWGLARLASAPRPLRDGLRFYPDR